MENNKMPGGYLVGHSHSEGGIKIKTPEGQIEAEGGEVIINKRVLAKDEKFVCEGTPKEITSKINEMEGGVSWSDTGSCKLVKKAEDGTEIETEGNLSDDGFGLLYTKGRKKYIITADTKDQIELIDMAIKDYKDGLIDKESLENTLQSYMNDEEEFSGDIHYSNGKPFVYNDFYRGYIELYDEMPIDATSSEIEFALGGGVKTVGLGYEFKKQEENLPKELVKQKINDLENQFQAIRLEFRNNALSQEEYFKEKQDLINKYNDYIDAARRQNIAINQALFLGIVKKKEEQAARGTILRSSNPEKRPSPSVSATVYPEGYEMVGNDGNMWVIAVDSRGVHRWKRLKAEDGTEIESDNRELPIEPIEQPQEKVATDSTELFVFNDNYMSGFETFYRFKEDMGGSTLDEIYFDFTYDFYKGGKYFCSAQIILNDFSEDIETAEVDKWDYATESHYTEGEGYHVTYTPGGFYIEATVDNDGGYMQISAEDMNLLKAEIGAIFKDKIMYYSSESLPNFQLTYGELLKILKKHKIEKAEDGMKTCGCGCGVAEDGKEVSSCGCSHSKYDNDSEFVMVMDNKKLIIQHRVIIEEEDIDITLLPKEIFNAIRDFNIKLDKYEETGEPDLFYQLQQDDVDIADDIQILIEANESAHNSWRFYKFNRKDNYAKGGGVGKIRWVARVINERTGEIKAFTDNLYASNEQEAWDKINKSVRLLKNFDNYYDEWYGFRLYDVKPSNEYKYAKGGGVESSQLKRGGFVSKGEMVWNQWLSSKRADFLYKHFTPEITPRGQEILVGKTWNFLPRNVKNKLQSEYANVEEYAKGGGVGDSGLMVIGKTTNDNNSIGDVVEEEGYYAEWNAREGYWFFPEEIDLYDSLEKELDKHFSEKGINARFEGVFANGGSVEQAARGKVIVTKISDIPNLEEELKAGRITYRGLGLGKLYNDFYEIANESGTRIKVKGKEYYITDTDFRKLNWDEKNKKWKNLIRFSAPYRKEDGGRVGKSRNLPENYYEHAIEQDGIIYRGDSYYQIVSNQPNYFFDVDERTRGYVDKDNNFYALDLDSGEWAYKNGGGVEQAEKGKELWFTPSGKLSAETKGTARKMIEMRLAQIFGATSMSLVGEDEKHFIYELEGNPQKIEMVTSKLQEDKGLDVETYGRKKRVHIPKTAILQSTAYVRFPLLKPFKDGGKIIDLPYKYISEFPGGIYLLMSVNDSIEEWDFKYGQGKVKKITENEWKKYLSSHRLIGVGTFFANGGDSAYMIAEYNKRKFKDGGKLEMLNDVPKGYLYLSNIANTSRKPNGKLTDVYKTDVSILPANQVEQVNLYLESLDMDYTMKDDVPHYNPNFSEENIPSTENYVIGLQVSPEKVRYFFVDTQGYDYPRYVTELINYNPDYYRNGGSISDNEMEIINGYERKSKEDYGNNLKLAKGDDEMISMYRRDFSDHVFVATLMRDGKWEMALETWRDMDTAARENISNEAYELLMGKNNLPTYRDGGGVGDSENKVWQIKNGNKYFSISMANGKPSWNESPDLGYTYDLKSALRLFHSLVSEYPDIEIVEYDKDWWKKEDGGETQYARGGKLPRITKKTIKEHIDKLRYYDNLLKEYNEQLKDKNLSEYEIEILEYSNIPKAQEGKDYYHSMLAYHLKQYYFQNGEYYTVDSKKDFDFVKEQGFEDGGSIKYEDGGDIEYASDGKPIENADYLTNAMLSIIDLHTYIVTHNEKIKIFGSEYSYLSHAKYNLRVTGGRGAIYNIIPYFPTSSEERLQSANFYTLVRQGRSYNFAITKQNEIIDLADDGMQILNS